MYFPVFKCGHGVAIRLGDRWAARSAPGPGLAGPGMRLHPRLAGVLALTAPSGASPAGYDPQTGGQDWDADVMGRRSARRPPEGLN